MQQAKAIGQPAFIGLGLVVTSFMLVSLCVTATGTARFVASMGYDIRIGYVVGAVFDGGKDLLPVGLIALWSRRALGRVGVIGFAWIALVQRTGR
jgi:hypothetical protein